MASSPTSSELEEPSTPRDTNNALDLEKLDTARSTTGTARSGPRVTRTQTLTRRNTRGRFTHPLAHVKTTEAEIVDFDGEDDPYRPVNWYVKRLGPEEKAINADICQGPSVRNLLQRCSMDLQQWVLPVRILFPIEEHKSLIITRGIIGIRTGNHSDI
jgi:hypothetical protein